MNEAEAGSGLWQSSESLVLKKLLASWNLDCLLDHFMDEGISVEVLQMLRPHHIPGLLRDHKLGLQIRFEHHLERWRRRIDKPLVDASHARAPAPLPRCACSQHVDVKPWPLSLPPLTPPTATATATTPATRNVATQFPLPPPPSSQQQQPRPAPTSPAPCAAASASESRPPPRLTPAPLSAAAAAAPTTSAAAPTPTATATPSAMSTPATSPSAPAPGGATPTGLGLGPGPGPCSGRPMKHSIFNSDEYRPPNVSLNLILQASQPKGPQLIDYYREHQALTSAHRLLLINLIATFFDDNDYHLSLQTSYNLEREILELFPSERLEFYRTEKRGKIYVKFCNMKRYKAVREKPFAKRLRRDDVRGSAAVAAAAAAAAAAGAGSGSGSGPGPGGDASGLGLGPPVHVDVMPSMEDDDFTMTFDSWEQPPPMEVYIKTENLNEDGYA